MMYATGKEKSNVDGTFHWAICELLSLKQVTDTFLYPDPADVAFVAEFKKLPEVTLFYYLSYPQDHLAERSILGDRNAMTPSDYSSDLCVPFPVFQQRASNCFLSYLWNRSSRPSMLLITALDSLPTCFARISTRSMALMRSTSRTTSTVLTVLSSTWAEKTRSCPMSLYQLSWRRIS